MQEKVATYTEVTCPVNMSKRSGRALKIQIGLKKKLTAD
jgi:hypothetical protein